MMQNHKTAEACTLMTYMHKGASQITKSTPCRQACLFMYKANPGDYPPRSALSCWLLDSQDKLRIADLAHKHRVLKGLLNKIKTKRYTFSTNLVAH